jgi:hypothetical protein
MTKNPTSGWGSLLTSLGLSLSAAIALIKGALYFQFRETLDLALPIIPVLFPLFYRILRREGGGATGPAKSSSPHSFLRRHLSLRLSEMQSLHRILIAVSLSLALKFVMEGLFLYTFYRKSGVPFEDLFGRWEDNLLLQFLRGDLLAVTTSQVEVLLLIQTLLLTAIGGLWIGITSTGSTSMILEGLFAGTILAFFATLTNLSLLYAHAESIASTLRFSADYSRVFALAGPLLQVFLYGWWTLVGRRCRRELSIRSTLRSARPRPARSR